MDDKTSRISGISSDLLQRYVNARQKINVEANMVYAITSMLCMLANCGDDKIEVDPIALGKIHQILNNNILNIWEILDDFIYIIQAESVLRDRGK